MPLQATTGIPPGIWHDQFDRQRDFAVATPARVRYVIASTPRSGSHLLGQMMADTDLLGDPLEYFNPANRSYWERMARASNEDVQQHIERRRTSPNGCFGMKLHRSHLRAATAALGTAELFTKHRFILVQREDVVAQAVSYSIAQQTGAWISAVPPQGEPTYDMTRIARNVVEICRHNAEWQALVRAYAQPHFAITYEKLCEGASDALSTIARFLGISLEGACDVGRPMTARQGDERNERWTARFLEEVTRGEGCPILDAVLAPPGRRPRGVIQRAMSLGRRAGSTLRA